MTQAPTPPAKLAATFKALLLPIFVFAPVNALICWTAAWIFRDRYEFMATFVGFGCGPIVIALCAYLYVLVSTISREEGFNRKER
jgi:hypothetical protein